MKLNQAKVQILADGSAAILQDAVNTFLQAAGEKTLVSVQFTENDTSRTAYIVYTE